MCRNPGKGMLFITLPQLLLVIIVAGLLMLMVSVCVKNIKGPLSSGAIKRQLLLLHSKLRTPNLVDPDMERGEMEKLQNKIKTSCSVETISGDNNLKSLFHDNGVLIQEVLRQQHLENRSGWIKLNALLSGFGMQYFRV